MSTTSGRRLLCVATIQIGGVINACASTRSEPLGRVENEALCFNPSMAFNSDNWSRPTCTLHLVLAILSNRQVRSLLYLVY